MVYNKNKKITKELEDLKELIMINSWIAEDMLKNISYTAKDNFIKEYCYMFYNNIPDYYNSKYFRGENTQSSKTCTCTVEK